MLPNVTDNIKALPQNVTVSYQSINPVIQVNDIKEYTLLVDFGSATVLKYNGVYVPVILENDLDEENGILHVNTSVDATVTFICNVTGKES
jgi:hypothetical protein